MDEKLQRYEKMRENLLGATYFFYEKLAFYSAGIISLSITFVGYLVSSSNNILFDEVLFLKLYQFLIMSWASLFLSLVLSLSIRLLGATYAARVTYKDWIKEQIESKVDDFANRKILEK